MPDTILFSHDVLDIRLGCDRKAATVAERFRGNFYAWRGLLALVLAAFHHANYALHQTNIEAAVGGNLVGGMRVFDVIFEDGVEHVVGWKRVAVHLAGAKFGGWWLVQTGLRNYRAERVDVVAQAVDQGVGNVGNCREAADHVAVESAVADGKLAFISGAEHYSAELIGKGHQQRTAGS